MDIQLIDINKLKAAEYNPRKISDSELNKLKNSITEFGLVDPIIINSDRTVIGGHQRLKELESLGHKEALCVIVDLSKDKEKVLNLSLNKISGDWDDDKLSELLLELENESDIDMALTGFDDDEIDELLYELEDELEEKTEELKPYKMTHILLSFSPMKLSAIEPHLKKILQIEGIEYEQSSN